jgi:thiamine-monophosphate kinase
MIPSPASSERFPRMMGEFDLIKTYFTRPTKRAVLGVGDDCALLALGPGMYLATSTDMLVEGRHFLSTVDPYRLGHKALAVNLSDLAACGARPLAFTLALALPSVDEKFLEGFSQGLLDLAQAHDCELIGGDTTRGPLNLCITVFGEVPAGQALLRSGARVGDDVYVSGALGDARLALEVLCGRLNLPSNGLELTRRALELPQPRVSLGMALRGLAHSAIDLSDGLLGDLHHVLLASGVGARLNVDAVPCSSLLQQQPIDWQHECTLAGGDDYELLFTAAPESAPEVQALAAAQGIPLTCIAQIIASERPGELHLHDKHGAKVVNQWRSFDHFAAVNT